MKRPFLIVLLLLGILGMGFGIRWYWGNQHKIVAYVPSVPVKQGEFLITINDTGIIKARKNAIVMTPETPGFWREYKINKLITEGTRVKKGDPIVWFDTTDLDKDVKDTEYEMKNQQSQLDQYLESLRLQRENKAKAMRQCLLDWDSAKLAYELEKKKYDKVKRLVTEDILPQNDFDDEQRKYRSASLTVDQAEKEYLKAAEQQASDERTKEIDIEKTKYQFTWATKRYAQLTTALAQTILYAPADGIVIIQKNWRGRGLTTLKEGDSVNPGNAIITIPDLSEIQVMTQVNETDLSKAQENMVVNIRIDAMKELQLTGKIEQIGTLAIEREQSQGSGQVSTEESAGIKVFEITVNLDSTDARLRPGMTCKTEIILDAIPNALYIPMKTIHNENEKYFVNVKLKSGGSEKRYITLGKQNTKDVIVTSGLKAGEEVLLPDEEGTK